MTPQNNIEPHIKAEDLPICLRQKCGVPLCQKLLLTIDEAALYSNIGQNKLTELVKNPRCNFVLYVGKKRLIKRQEFEEYIRSQVEV